MRNAEWAKVHPRPGTDCKGFTIAKSKADDAVCSTPNNSNRSRSEKGLLTLVTETCQGLFSGRTCWAAKLAFIEMNFPKQESPICSFLESFPGSSYFPPHAREPAVWERANCAREQASNKAMLMTACPWWTLSSVYQCRHGEQKTRLSMFTTLDFIKPEDKQLGSQAP